MTEAERDPRIPVHVLTGFLGSGKTTLLRHLLADPGLADTAVVINEFGEVGLDHLLVRQVSEDVVLLGSGCLCCTMRDDLVSTLANLQRLAQAGDVPIFARAAVETTGLADPLPIAGAVLSEARLFGAYRLGRVIATVDAVCGMETLDAHATAVTQVAAADQLILTKTDLVSAETRQPLCARLERLNPAAPLVLSAPHHMPSGDALLADAPASIPRLERSIAVASGGHDSRVESFVVAFDGAVSWSAFVDWLELLLAARGDSILRVKGLLSVEGEDRPVVIQGVQHVVYPPETLDGWPDAARSHLVFIARDLTRTAVAHSLHDVLGVTVAEAPARGHAH